MTRWRTCGTVVGSLILVCALSAIIYRIGWCVGWWEREKITVEDKYLCNCPGLLRTARLPENVRLVSEGCDASQVVISPSRRKLLLFNWEAPHFVVDIDTGKSTKIKLPNHQYYGWLGGSAIIRYQLAFLTDDLLFSWVLREPQILDYRTGKAVQLRKLCRQVEECLEDLAVLTEFGPERDVYLLDGFAVGLTSEFRENPAEAFYIDNESFSDVHEYLHENDIGYQLSDSVGSPGHSGSFQGLLQLPDPDPTCSRLFSSGGEFYYRHCEDHTQGGIYDHASGQRLIQALADYEPLSWSYDDGGVLLARKKVCIFQMFTDACGGWSPVHVLELRIPEEYLVENIESGSPLN